MDKPNPPNLPSVLAPSDIIPAMEKIISKFHQMKENMAEVANETQGQLGMIWLLSYAAPDQEAHDAVDAVDRLFSNAVATWTSRTDLFVLSRAAADKDEELDPESRLWIQSKLSDFISAGHGLADEKTIKQYLSKRSVIDQLRKQYNNNLRNNNAGLWIDEADLVGVPESNMKSWTIGCDGNNGKRFVPFANGGYKTVMARAHKEKTRERMYLAEEAKAPANVDILRNIISMRDSQARLLIFDNHGSFRIQNRAIKSTEYVEKFLEQLKRSLVPHGRDELQALRQIRDEHRLLMENAANCDDFTENDRFYLWDLEYCKRIHSLRSQIDDVEISQFFPLEHTVLAMLRLFESFLGLKFIRISSDHLDPAWIWHEDVQIWEAWDEEETEFIGFLYLDILWHENKYQGSQNVNIESGYLKPDGTRNFPATEYTPWSQAITYSGVSFFDLKIHTPQTHEEIEQVDLGKLWYNLREEIEGLDMTRSRAVGHEQATFSHLLSGYDMGYYGYLSCQAYAQDVFQENFAKDLHNQGALDRFRYGILEYGGCHPDLLQMLQDYLGREPNYSALQENLLL
ncbi:hypothetical protein MKX08_007405 [Trichoderma sp. CBMAI-0020]|nr:hypothetical protein MKX08_007405 [Trichoderma sp. CBMAI-0020]